jgi:small subunit ribosomal protein S2
LATITLESLFDNGVHFGHRASRWNPKMKPYIHGKRDQIHLIDLRETVRGLLRARHYLGAVSAEGGKVLWVGTKRSAKEAIRMVAVRTNQPFVTERWLGGTLTNFKTIRSRLGRLDELEEIEAEGTYALLSKKQQSRHRIEKKKILKNLEGVRDLHGLPACLVVVDPKNEHIAVAEANKMRIPVIAILDTDCDPDTVDIAIPGNDDAMRSVNVLLGLLAAPVEEGNKAFAVIQAERDAIAAKAQREQEAQREAERQRRQVTEDWQRKLREEAQKKGGGAVAAAPAADAGAATATDTAEAPAAEAPAGETAADAKPKDEAPKTE